MNDDLIQTLQNALTYIKNHKPCWQQETVYYVSREVWQAYERGEITDKDLHKYAFETQEIATCSDN